MSYFSIERTRPPPLLHLKYRKLTPGFYISAELSILFRRTRFSSRGLGKYILSPLLRGYFVLRGTLPARFVNPSTTGIPPTECRSIPDDSFKPRTFEYR